ncbi:MAG: APC family permease [Acidobacteria bacterium]|nr:APC family permease [Acidobacteriota bacterium]
MVAELRRFMLGEPLATAHVVHERLSKVKALAVFSSDALSSVAYATEEILLVLVLAGTAALHLSTPIAVAIAVLLVILTISYRQTIQTYPSGGGAYIVAKDNLGTYPGLIAGAALLIDYVLTVAVSIAAGVAAMTSAFPSLAEHRILLAIFFITLITIANLRGVRESGTIFSLPTYMFIVSIFLLIGVGWAKHLLYGTGPITTAEPSPPVQGLTTFLILRAFASGCTALTGVEAISNGVPAFRPPESRNASTTLVWMSVTLLVMFLGITSLAHLFRIIPHEGETVVSQLASNVFGRGSIYYLVQASTTLILVLAANTSFADFPRLASLIARDRFLPRQLANLGDRLVFSNGIIILGLLACLLIILFGGRTHALIPLYAVGVFLSFTLSQSGMVVRWSRQRGNGWGRRAAINGIGALATCIVLIVFATVKFSQGAWIVVLLIPTLVFLFRQIHHHYEFVGANLTLRGFEKPREIRHIVLVPVSDIHRGVVTALEYAKSICQEVRAVYVDLNVEVARAMRQRWKQWYPDVPLVVLESPYRSVIEPLLDYIDEIKKDEGLDTVTVLLPEFVTPRWWQSLLHNQTALLIKGALLFKKGVIVTSVPYHLQA